MTELDHWPTMEEAAQQLRISMRTMWRHSQRGALEIRPRAAAGRKPVNVCNPADVEKLKPGPYVYVARTEAQEAKHQAKNGVVPAIVPVATGLEPVTIGAILEALQTIATVATGLKAVTDGTKLWLTLDEAALYSGMARSVLRRATISGEVASRRDGPRGATIIQRASLERFSAQV